MRKSFRHIRRFFTYHTTSVFWILALVLFLMSFMHITPVSSEKRARFVEHMLQNREKTLQSYVDKAFGIPENEWITFEHFPEDMVLYRYIDGKLQSWVNTFPISNDDIRSITSWYRIHDLRNRNIFNIPLAFLKDSTQYINLGPKWYIIKTYDRGGMRIIAGIEIIEQYDNENEALQNSYNKHIGLNNKFTTVPTFIDGAGVVHTADGTPAFSVIRKNMFPDSNSSGLRWLALLAAITAILYYQHTRKSITSLYFGLGGLLVLQLCTFPMVQDIPASTEFFSPMLYADGNFRSFGSLILMHSFVFLYCATLYMSRKTVIRNILSSSPAMRRLKSTAIGAAAVCLAVYIHMTFRSLILNSGINFDLYLINDISVYTVITFFIYSLLALALLFLVTILISVSCTHFRVKRKRHSKRLALIYILLISIYMTGSVGYYGFQKECENLRVLTGRLAMERDLDLEMQLQAIEKSIITDPLIRRLTGNPDFENIILNRLAERYFFNIMQDYDIRLTICNMFQRIKTDEYSAPVGCYTYFKEIIDNYGIPLSDISAFYYLDYFSNSISYLGAFSIIRNGTRYDMYLEIDSKSSSKNIGYPSTLLDNSSPVAASLPYPYSMAKYHQGRITGHQGDYNFPVSVNVNIYEDGFSHYFMNDCVLFINKLPGTNLIAVSRPERTVFPSLISFSYIFLFFAMVILGFPSLFRHRHRESLFRPKRSFRMKITLFLTCSTVIALVLMAIGSIFIVLRYIKNNNTVLMEDKLVSVQNALAKSARIDKPYNESNSLEISNAMSVISKNAQVDINLFAPDGKLIRTTRPEIFNEYLSSSRMNPEAYYELVFNKRMQVIQEESISAIDYYALYTPIYNEDGLLLGIANIPYFITDTNFENDASPIIAAIINMYLILIITAFLIGIAMANSITKPLKEISKNMLAMDISHKVEHINYKADDELGILVKTYNKMIDDLDRSTKELAQSEREMAWKEMAKQIAHEIKNPLTPMKLSIQHLVSLKKQGIPGWENRLEALASSLIEQIDILSNTASEFSSLAKLYNDEVTEVDLVEILSEQKILFDNYDNIELTFRCRLEKAITLACKSQITRVFVNLITNAIQAVESQEYGEIVVSIQAVHSYYKVDIEDNGSGVSEENMEKLFSPNFTTKTRGSGLGLAICKNIVAQSGGEIYYSHSIELGGADFTVKLPIHYPAKDNLT